MIISLILRKELRYYHQDRHHRYHHWRRNSLCSNRSLAPLARHTSPCCFAMALNKTLRRSLAALEQSGSRSLRSNKAAVARCARTKRQSLAALEQSGGRSLRSNKAAVARCARMPPAHPRAASRAPICPPRGRPQIPPPTLARQAALPSAPQGGAHKSPRPPRARQAAPRLPPKGAPPTTLRSLKVAPSAPPGGTCASSRVLINSRWIFGRYKYRTKNGDNHIYIIASDNNDYRLRLPAACPPLARRLPADCPPLARRLPAACPPLARRLPAACVDIIYISMGGHPISK